MGAHVGVPTMSAVLAPLAKTLLIHHRTSVLSITGSPFAWREKIDDRTSAGPFDRFVRTAPAPESLTLLWPFDEMSRRHSKVAVQPLKPCYVAQHSLTRIFVFSRRLNLGG